MHTAASVRSAVRHIPFLAHAAGSQSLPGVPSALPHSASVRKGSLSFSNSFASKSSSSSAPDRCVATAAGGQAMAIEEATLAGGCFWCLDACYRQLRGVTKVESGYADGHTRNPTYKQICGGDTGHAEVVQITFDPSVISFKDLLEVFFTIHDPTTLNRQGNDAGTQYRSAILYHSDAQKATAEEVMKYVAEQNWYGSPIVTQLRPYDPHNYYPAEEYHQDYYTNNPSQGYCRAVVGPKVSKFRSKFLKRLRA